jgi:hypothetical protein
MVLSTTIKTKRIILELTEVGDGDIIIEQTDLVRNKTRGIFIPKSLRSKVRRVI